MRQPASGSVARGARWMTAKFIECYRPRLHARAFVLSRAHEYQADQLAGTIAGAPAMALALWRLECLNPWFSERFWPDLYREAARLSEPPEILDRMTSAFRDPPAPDNAVRWVPHGLSRATGSDDTHPSLRDRVRSLGLSVDDLMKAGFPAPIASSAAEVLIGADLDAITKELDVDHTKVASGRYLSASEVVREALRLLEERDSLNATKLKQLQEAIRVGLDQADRGELVDGPAVFAELRTKVRVRSENGRGE
jgi:putative addiction module CopG family antidote